MSPDYQDSVRIVLTDVDGYGSEVYSDDKSVAAAVELNTGLSRAANRATVTSDAVAYIDPSDAWVIANLPKLEGALILIELFGRGLGHAWFRIDTVTVARDHQLSNQIDNILLNLSKSTGIEGVS